MANTSIATVAPDLVQKAWAKATWEAGIHESYFNKFTGTSSGSIVQIKEELKKGAGDSINIPLLMPLKGDGVKGDNKLEDNEEEMLYRDFDVSIDQYRNAVRLAGRMDEKKTQINMRSDAKNVLANWLARKTDMMIFDALTTDPSANRVIYAGSATSAATISAADTFSTDLIGKAKRIALADEDTAIRPVRINGADHYVMIVDQWQARDLMKDQKWLEAQQYANVRGESNPIFTGALGMYNGVVVHMCNRLPRKTTGASGVKVGNALFLGAQAAVMAIGEEPTWDEETFDYGNQHGFKIGRIFGVAKSHFKFDGNTDTDYGCINVLTSSVDD